MPSMWNVQLDIDEVAKRGRDDVVAVLRHPLYGKVNKMNRSGADPLSCRFSSLF